MDCGACLGCGLGITNNNEGIPWQSGKPNPLPIFNSADGFWTPLLLPGLYLPVGLIAPQNEQSGLLYHPLSDRDLVDRLTAFIIHESVHQTLLLGIIPATLRLSAANFYSGLATLLTNDFDTDLWNTLNHLNHSIKVIHDATKAMHEAAAIVENEITAPFNNPYIQDLSEISANRYAEDYGSEFIRYYQTFRLLITVLKDQFSPTPLHRLTIIALADYIISSAIDLQELANHILSVPAPIPETHLRDYMGAMGIPYLESGDLIGQRTLETCPFIQISFGGFAIYGVAPRLDRTMSAILSAKFKRHRKMSENYIDQLLYIAELVPELKLWLQSIEARHWVKRRILSVISDHQAHLEQVGIPLLLTSVWRSDISALISLKLGDYGENMYTLRVGRESEDFLARARNIPHNHWIAYGIQKNVPLGIVFGPRCSDGIPLEPSANILCYGNTLETGARLKVLITFESARMQLAEGCGLVCPWFEGKDDSCCGGADFLWQVYNLGETAKVKSCWHPDKWDPPECAQPETTRFRKAKIPPFDVPSGINIFL